MSSEKQPAVEYHPSYDYPDGDLVLVTKDGIKFRVHTQIMRIASGVFSDMLGIQRAASETADDPIPIDERADVFCAVLDIVYPAHRFPKDVQIDFLQDVAFAARKYDMQAVTDFVQTCVHAPQPLKHLSALEKYGFAWNMGWKEQAREISALTLSCDLNSDDAREKLARIDTMGVLKLQALHRRRQTTLFDTLCRISGEGPFSSKPTFVAIPPILRASHPNSRISSLTCGTMENLRNSIYWSRFKLRVLSEMEKDSSGHVFSQDAFFDSQDMLLLLKERCPCTASMLLVDKKPFVEAFRTALARLPTTIDV